jgi:hypothetical protein
MKRKTTIILIVLGFLIVSSLCICTPPSTEGLNTMKTETHILRRGEYMDDIGYLKSEDDGYRVAIRYGYLICFVKTNNIWKQLWSMNANGSKIMLLNEHGILQFKTSRNSEPITTLMSKGSVTGSSLVLTSYGTLELKSGTNGNGDTLFTYPVTEGFDPDPDDISGNRLMGALEDDRSELTKHVVKSLNSHFTDSANGDTGKNLPDDIDINNWNSFRNSVYTFEPSGAWLSTAELKAGYVVNYDDLPGHNKLLKNGRELRRLQNTLDSRIKVLNQLGDSHVTEKQIHLDSTIYISLVWTVIASSLVYYTFAQ